MTNMAKRTVTLTYANGETVLHHRGGIFNKTTSRFDPDKGVLFHATEGVFTSKDQDNWPAYQVQARLSGDDPCPSVASLRPLTDEISSARHVHPMSIPSNQRSRKHRSPPQCES